MDRCCLAAHCLSSTTSCSGKRTGIPGLNFGFNSDIKTSIFSFVKSPLKKSSLRKKEIQYQFVTGCSGPFTLLKLIGFESFMAQTANVYVGLTCWKYGLLLFLMGEDWF
jgi:hypothetical protein